MAAEECKRILVASTEHLHRHSSLKVSKLFPEDQLDKGLLPQM